MAEKKAPAYSGWNRVIDYMLGRNAMIGLASLMLLVISGYATWSGMSDFIVGVQSGASSGRDLFGGLSVTNDMLVIGIVVALTFLMWLSLRETFGAQRTIVERMITAPLYIFLFLWSIGFGYGFWWSLIAGEEATRTSLTGLQEDARDAAAVVAARLDAVGVQLDNVVTWSDSQMHREEVSGGSCGKSSGAGRGPLYSARESVKNSVASLRDSVSQSWLGAIQTDLEVLRKTAASLEGGTVAERQKNFEDKAATIRGKARNIAARSNAMGKSTGAEMRALADSLSVAPGKSGFSCYDPTLAQRLRRAAEQAEAPAVLRLRDAAFTEGPAGVANAVKNLWENIGSYFSGMINYIVTLGHPGDGKTASGEPITGRDLIALMATLGVDLGLLALAALNPPGTPPIRQDGLAETQARLRLPSAAVVHQITGVIQTAIRHAPGGNLDWVRQHFFHHNNVSYFVIPNLFSLGEDKDEEQKGLAMNQLAGVLDDLELVKVLTDAEYEKVRNYEMDWGFAHRLKRRIGLGSDDKTVDEVKKPGRKKHGLIAKAARVLDIAGWDKQSQSDIEIFKLRDKEGLTPLLMALDRAKELPAMDVAEAKEKSIS